MEVFTQLLNTINELPPEAWEVVVEVIFGAVIVSPTALAFKNWYRARKDIVPNEKTMVVLVAAGSLFTAGLMYLRNDPNYGPGLVMVEGWLILATTQPVYFLGVKPLARRFSNWLGQHVAQAMLKNEARNAAVPPEGLPVDSAPPNMNDFGQ